MHFHFFLSELYQIRPIMLQNCNFSNIELVSERNFVFEKTSVLFKIGTFHYYFNAFLQVSGISRSFCYFSPPYLD